MRITSVLLWHDNIRDFDSVVELVLGSVAQCAKSLGFDIFADEKAASQVAIKPN